MKYLSILAFGVFMLWPHVGYSSLKCDLCVAGCVGDLFCMYHCYNGGGCSPNNTPRCQSCLFQCDAGGPAFQIPCDGACYISVCSDFSLSKDQLKKNTTDRPKKSY